MAEDIKPISADDLALLLVQRIKDEILPELPEVTTVKEVLEIYDKVRTW
jgi:hypothetical protein